ncbi:MAG: hypothetical protein B6I36_05440 [Desulfobacteraceae bacterium 4572_35.1]|nr:MAG: hypothetical protein B6I36_05440 [Desulfobacteraceae bacterium 4572_35.1]
MTVGKRNEQTFTIRGYDQRQVPVLLDGIPLVVPYDGYIDNGSLPLDNLAKITLTRGPGSVLYGSNAMGGVVNIITRRPEQPVELRCNAGAGERGAAWGHLALGYRAEHYYLMTDFSARDEDDFRLSDDYEDTNNENGEIRFNSDRQSNHVAIKLGLLPAIGHEYALGVNYVDSEWGMPVAADGRQRYWRFSDWRRTSWYLSGRSVIGDAGELQSRIYYDTFDNVLDSYDDQSLTTQSRRYAFHSTYDDYSYGGSSIYHPGVSAVHDLGLSFHYRRDTHREQGDHGAAWETSRSELYSCGFEDNYDLNQQLSLVVGVSYDLQRPVAAASGFQRDDEDAWNPMAGLSWQINESLRSWFTVARKTRFPTLKELYSGINNDRVLPNGDLSEEHSTHYEIGCEHQLGSNMRTRLCLFYSDISDLIEEKSVDSNVSQKQNIGDARYVGGEISFYYKLPRQHDFINIHYTFLNAQNVSSSRTSDHLSGRPQHKLHIDHRWQISDSLQLVTSLQWNGSRYCEQDTEDWHKLSPYWMLNSQLNVAVNKQWGVQCGVTNLLDEDYALDVDYSSCYR